MKASSKKSAASAKSTARRDFPKASRIRKNNETQTYPMRINRRMGLLGLSTRREADALIAAGRVFVNGRQAALGDRVSEDDHISLHPDKHAADNGGQARYVLYYKPRGVLTHAEPSQPRDIHAVSGFPGLFPVGRLDKESEGLIFLTNDGRITERLLSPRAAHEKEYEVTVQERLGRVDMRRLVMGIESSDGKLRAKEASVKDPHTLVLVLTEGKKHQVRRMLDAVHLTVTQLVRTRILGFRIDTLQPGQGRALRPVERQALLKALGLSEKPSAP
ncbi:MAG: pseudouridine synthase [Candidatus Moraniibacteriota bacterium]